jgi:DNA-binding NarL/FixJ family response regulator
MTLNILVADDHEVVRAGLKALLSASDISVVAEAADGNTAFKLAKKYRPDLVSLDVRMPVCDGLTCLGRLKVELPRVPVIIFSSFDSPTYMARALALGAAGYLLKSTSADKIVKAIRAAATGDAIWTKEVLRQITGELAPPGAVADAGAKLTRRESEVLKQLAFGLTNKEIALSLGIGYETVKEHVQHILQKVEVSDRTQAAVWAVRKKLI